MLAFVYVYTVHTMHATCEGMRIVYTYLCSLVVCGAGVLNVGETQTAGEVCLCTFMADLCVV